MHNIQHQVTFIIAVCVFSVNVPRYGCIGQSYLSKLLCYQDFGKLADNNFLL